MGKSKSKSSSKDATTTAGAPPASGLSSFLLGQADSKDSALEDIFATSVRPRLPSPLAQSSKLTRPRPSAEGPVARL